MVPAAGLVPWTQLKAQVKTTEEELEGMAAEQEELITSPEEARSAGATTVAEMHILVMVPKAWDPNFL